VETRGGDWFQPGFPARRKRALGIFLGVALLAAYAVTALRGPQGVEVLFEKYREIRKLEAQNAADAVENERRKERIERLRSSPSEQEMEIRKQLKILRPGETTCILPDTPKFSAPAAPDAQPQR